MWNWRIFLNQPGSSAWNSVWWSGSRKIQIFQWKLRAVLVCMGPAVLLPASSGARFQDWGDPPWASAPMPCPAEAVGHHQPFLAVSMFPLLRLQAVLAWHPSFSNVKSYRSDMKALLWCKWLSKLLSQRKSGLRRFLCVCSGWRLRGRIQEYKFTHHLLHDSVCSQPPSVQRSLFLFRLSHNSPISKKTFRLQRQMRLPDY